MSLSVLVFTEGHPFAARFLDEFGELARELSAEYVIAGDHEQGYEMARRYADLPIRVDTQGLQEHMVAEVAAQCFGDWVLKLDDDETVSPAMREFLMHYDWWQAGPQAYSFPYAWLWGDEDHFITSPPFWVDPHGRLMKKGLMLDWPTGVHQNNPHTGPVIPVALCHHKFLVKTQEERREVARRYDAFMQGAGSGPHYGKFTLPEEHCKELTVREVGTGDVLLSEWILTGQAVKV
jgi:hypothetical protein